MLTEIDVKIEKTEEGYFMLYSVPVLRTGIWNGMEFTHETLEEIVNNFYTIKNVDNYIPPLWPTHSFSIEGEPVSIDARDIIGYHVDLYIIDDVLCSDFIIFEEEDIEDIQKGKLKYISVELASGYVDSQGRELGIALIGSAFVGVPAVKPVNWKPVFISQKIVSMQLDTTEQEPFPKSDLPDSCFLIPEERKLPYRDPDVSSGKDDKGRYRKAGPINCRRVRAALAALKGARNSQITINDLSENAIRKLLQAIKLCNISSSIEDELRDNIAQEE